LARDPAKGFSVQVTSRLSEGDYRILQEGCESSGENVGSFIRRAILKEMARLGWLDKERSRLLLPKSDKEI
jgi:hypothetical protein